MAQPRRIIVYGAGGHGKVVADAARKHGFTVEGFLDDTVTGTVLGLPVLGDADAVKVLRERGIDGAVVAVGSPAARGEIMEKLRDAGLSVVSVIHPSAVVAESAAIGDGTVILPQAVIGPDARMGEGCIVNTAATVDHDCVLGACVHVSPGAHLAGTVTVGERTQIGIGSSVKEGVTIGADSLIGAGSVVVEDIPAKTVAFGVPAKPVRSHHV